MQIESFGNYEYHLGYTMSADGFEEYQFVILQKGISVAQQECSQYTSLVSLGEQGFLDNQPIEHELVDLNNDGSLELIIQHYSGGAHCCYQYWIYSLGETLQKLALLEPKDSALLFNDLNGDGIYEIEGVDKTFAYWQSDYASSPSPRIVLTFTADGLKLDAEKMRRPAPIETELANTVMRVRSELGRNISSHQDETWRAAGIPPAMWSNMLDLIYTGNGDKAWEFFDRVWRTGVKGKKEFRAAFTATLESSPYWEGIRELNGW